jgi:hypothetical protein
MLPAAPPAESEASLEQVNQLLANVREEEPDFSVYDDIQSALLGVAKIERPADPVPQIKVGDPGKKAEERKNAGGGVDRMRSQPVSKNSASELIGNTLVRLPSARVESGSRTSATTSFPTTTDAHAGADRASEAARARRAGTRRERENGARRTACTQMSSSVSPRWRTM